MKDISRNIKGSSSYSQAFKTIRTIALLTSLIGFSALVGCGPAPGTVTKISSPADNSYSVQAEARMNNVGDSASYIAEKSIAPLPQQPTLGTQWGEGLASGSRSVDVIRLNPNRPDQVAAISYQDASLVSFPRSQSQLTVPLLRGEVELSVVDEYGNPLPIYKNRRNQYVLGGIQGQRYSLRYQNLSRKNFEIVSTVDGLDVLSGKAGSHRNRGYLLRGGDTLVIDGFRKSQSEVAAFRFAKPDRAYAANTPAGDVRNIGVIGTAIFSLRNNKSLPQQANPFPADNGFAPAPLY